MDSSKVFANRYKITEKIGITGMAEVYKAFDEVLGRNVAVKILSPAYTVDPEFPVRFRQEAQAAASLSNPYIVNFYDYGQDQGLYYLVMEYVQGADVKRAIQSRGAIGQRKVAEIGMQTCDALQAAHAYRIVHAAINSGNIMVSPDGNVKVTDFGVPRLNKIDLSQMRGGYANVQYLAPEQVKGRIPTAASDIYSLGIVLYEALTGQLPFDDPDTMTVALMQLRDAPLPPSRINPTISPTLEAIVMRALEKNPANRFATAADMKAELDRFLRGRSKPAQVANPPQAVYAGTPAGYDQTQVISPRAIEAGAAGTLATGGSARISNPANRAFGEERTPSPYADGTSVMPSARSDYARHNENSFDDYNNRGGRRGEYRGREDNAARQYSRLEEGMQHKRRKWPIILAIVLALVLIGGGVGVYFLFFKGGGKQVDVPDVTTLTQIKAEQALTAAGLVIGNVTQENSDTIPAGNVISQTPAAGSKAKAETKIALVVSSGAKDAEKTTVPDISGMSPAQAETAIIAAKLVPKAGDGLFDSATPAGKVAKQSPTASSQVAEGSTVTYSISLGTENTSVPDVTGQTQANATSALAALGLAVSVNEEYSSTVATGNISSQNPSAGTSVAAGSTVAITVSKGAQPTSQVDVPNLLGLTEEAARKSAQSAGLSLNISYLTSVTGTSTVSEQSPAAGTKVDAGSAINITILHAGDS